eukprot:CAMPEP_0197828028 /NCGR_PEP_ID=MMETSP1437-20131217/4679_1 /TAXON_ID=49252 ORGANISM="Eucampia antarctica, Strain CCMP1452" /NCGR_SAMPLE_ID=MMETSP1437 /ASSEMBLY_ACC=CAM_ASM_001096 /LENGTH=414 /DNA_ID=CAMNT_0043429099 /DNA_START=28 /DNA_END=1269 /DNA_ORIENTATION=+
MEKHITLLTNRAGSYEGISGGGSAMREKLLSSLEKEGHKVTCLAAGKNDMKVTDSVRGPLLRLSMHNISILCKVISQSDLLIVSGSYTPLWVVGVSMARFVYDVPTLFICTMNADKAGATWSDGTWKQRIAWHLFTHNDIITSSISQLTYTRSATHATKLRDKFGMHIDGVMVQTDQYISFYPPTTDEHFKEREEARSWLTNGYSGSDKNLLLFAGRLIPEKRINLLVKCKPENCILAVVGAVTNESEKEQVMKLHNPQEGIFIHVGFVSHSRLRTLYWAADAHVSASDYETLGNTVHESILCGTPVVIENAGGYISQVSTIEKQGLLVDYTSSSSVHSALQQVFEVHGCTTMDKKYTHSVLCRPLERDGVVEGTQIVKNVFQKENSQLKSDKKRRDRIYDALKNRAGLISVPW